MNKNQSCHLVWKRMGRWFFSPMLRGDEVMILDAAARLLDEGVTQMACAVVEGSEDRLTSFAWTFGATYQAVFCENEEMHRAPNA